jgi:hypothetical protein
LGGADQCLSESACTSMRGDVYACKGTANCAGSQICCFRAGAAPGGGDLAQCQDSCGSRTSGAYQVCQTTADCPMGRMCTMGGGAVVTVCR